MSWNLGTQSCLFSYCTKISMANCIKRKTKAKLDLLHHIDVLLMVQKGVRGGICHAIYWYAKVNNWWMEDYDKNEELSYVSIGMWMIYTDGQCHKSCPRMVLSGSRIENYNELSDQRYFFEVDIQHSEKLHGLQNDLPFLPGKTMENVRKHRDMKLVTSETRRNYLVSKPNYHITKIFSENSLDIEMKITQIFMNKSV